MQANFATYLLTCPMHTDRPNIMRTYFWTWLYLRWDTENTEGNVTLPNKNAKIGHFFNGKMEIFSKVCIFSYLTVSSFKLFRFRMAAIHSCLVTYNFSAECTILLQKCILWLKLLQLIFRSSIFMNYNRETASRKWYG